MKEQNKTPEEELSEVEISNLPDKEFKVVIIKTFMNSGERMDEQLFTTEHDVSSAFVIYNLYYVEVCSLYAHFLESFHHKSMLNLVKSFFCIC